MKALVTGGAGFIGSHVVDLLVENGSEVVVIDNLSNGDIKNINNKAKFYKKDINDDLHEIFLKEKFDYVFHLAANINLRKSIEDPVFDTKVNVLGSVNLLELCVKHKVKKFIFSSTSAVYDDKVKIPTSETEEERPLSPYGISKLTVERLLFYYKKVFGLESVSLRYSNVYGPRQSPEGEAGVVSIFINSILRKKQPVIFGDGKQTRDYVYVKDVAESNLLAIKQNISGVYNISTGVETDVNTLFDKITGILGVNISKKYGPAVKGELLKNCLSFAKFNKATGCKPEYSLDKGLKETVQFFKKK